MKALVWRGTLSLDLEEHPEPIVAGGEVLATILATAICGSDLHAYRGRGGTRVPPLILGHEGVVRTPDGRRAAVFPLIPCGRCARCGSGRSNLCEERGLLSLTRPGLLAERVALPESCLVLLPDEVDDLRGSLVEPLSVSLHVLRGEELPRAAPVLVIGCGPIGLLAVWALVADGHVVTAVDPVGPRRVTAERLGAARTRASLEEAVAMGPYELVVDAVGRASTIELGVAALASGGRLALLGLAEDRAGLDVGAMVRRGLTIYGSYAYLREDFAAAVDLMASHPIPTDWLTVLPLEEGAKAFQRLDRDPSYAAKVVFRPATTAGSRGGC